MSGCKTLYLDIIITNGSALFEAYQSKWTSEGTPQHLFWPHDLVNFQNNCARILLFASILLEPCTFGGTVFVGGGGGVFVGGGPYLSDKNGPGGPNLA